MTKETAWKVFKRGLLEFIPPTIAGLFWLYMTWKSGAPNAERISHFTTGFIAVGLVWSVLLRIVHQETQRQQQSGIAGGVGGVRTEVQTIKTTMASLEAKVDAMLPKLPSRDAEEISDLIKTANTQIDSVGNYFLNAEHNTRRRWDIHNKGIS